MMKKLNKKAYKYETVLGHFHETKKGMSQMWWIIATAIIAILAVIFIIIWFKGSGDKLFGGIDDTIGGLSDKDGDGVTDLFDKCPCDPNIKDKFPEGHSGKCDEKIKCPDKK